MTDGESKVDYDPLAPAAPWSTRQQLALCAAVLNCGNESWNPVSKSLRLFAEPGQDLEWCAPKNCAKQYALLLDRSELKRSREYSWGDLPWQELIVKRLTVERLEEAQNAIRKDQEEYRKLKEEIVAIQNGEMESRIEILWEKAKLDHKLEHYETDYMEEVNAPRKKSPSPDKNINTELELPFQSAPSTEIHLKTRRSLQKSDNNSSSKQPPQKSWKQLRLDKSANIVSVDSSKSVATNPDNSSNPDVWVIEKSSSPNPAQRRMTRNSLSSATDFGGIPTLKLQRSPNRKRSSRRANSGGEEAALSPGAFSNTSSTSATTAMTMSSESSDATVIANEKEISFSFHMDQELDFQGVQEDLLLEEISVEKSPVLPPARTLRSKRSFGEVDSGLPVRKRMKKTSKDVCLNNSIKAEDSLKESYDSGLNDAVCKSPKDEELTVQTELTEVEDSIDERKPESEETASDDTDDSEMTKKNNQEEDIRMWKRAMLVFLQNLMTHRHSTVFCNPVREEEAVGYSKVVFRPMDLHKLRRRIETCEINTTAELVRDLMLIFTNAIMFNSSEHLVSEMATAMFIDAMDLMEECLTVRSIDPYVDPRNYGEDLISCIIKK